MAADSRHVRRGGDGTEVRIYHNTHLTSLWPKAEMPTPRRLRDARQKGRVCTSKDVVSTALLVVLLAITGVLGVKLTDDVSAPLRFIGMRIEENDALPTGSCSSPSRRFCRS